MKPVASIPIAGRCSLRPVKNRGDFDKVVDQNFPLFFTGKTTPLTKLPPFLFSLFSNLHL